ncbi:hypothetical protein ACJ8P1_25810, partial [Serratia sp. CY85266]
MDMLNLFIMMYLAGTRHKTIYYSQLEINSFNLKKTGLSRKRAARTVLTGMCYSFGNATRQGSSSLTRFIGQS